MAGTTRAGLAWHAPSRTLPGHRGWHKSGNDQLACRPERGHSSGAIPACLAKAEQRGAEAPKSVLGRSRSIVEIKQVASRSDRLDNIALSADRESPAQMDHVCIDSSRVNDGVALPRGLDKLFA
jgi:hypothetical protein